MCAVDCWRHVLRRCGSAAVAAPMGARVWREVRQWERGRERVSVCLFVTLCHLSKYSCIVVRCESPRVWVSSSLLLPTIESYDRVRYSPAFDAFILSVVRA